MQPQARAILQAIAIEAGKSAQFLRYRIELEC